MPDHVTEPDHGVVDARGVQLHYARLAGGPRLPVLLHGSPESLAAKIVRLFDTVTW
jgi:hypothetical protein